MIRPEQFRSSWPSVVRILAARTNDLDGAEEAAAEAFARAAASPDDIENLTAWCVSVGLRLWIDGLRRKVRGEELIAEIPEAPTHSGRDDRLDLLMVVCDPALSATSQLTLALRVVL
ncbi:hypothetical protein [Microbacterium gorillae]|uniref:hypothetical protein n=1 Tax=Microbacterium gorillae TaxID=1231063 RepID=UPI00058B62E8|nr:hypothetical protein [Microbacterium gorillae]